MADPVHTWCSKRRSYSFQQPQSGEDGTWNCCYESLWAEESSMRTAHTLSQVGRVEGLALDMKSGPPPPRGYLVPLVRRLAYAADRPVGIALGRLFPLDRTVTVHLQFVGHFVQPRPFDVVCFRPFFAVSYRRH